MRLRWAAFLFVVVLLVPAEAGDLGWTRYTNDRYGASVDVPRALFKAEPPPDNGDGQTFTSKEDNAVIRIYGSLYTVTADSFVAYAKATIKDAASDGLDVTYKAIAQDSFAYSGYKKDLIVYSRTIIGCKDVAETFEIEYPASSKSLYDPLVTRMARSLDARSSLECH